MLNVVCPNCKSEFDVDEKYVGKRAKCAKCGTRFVISDANDCLAPISDPLAELLPPEPSWQPVNWAASSQPPAANPGTPVSQPVSHAGLRIIGTQGKTIVVDGATIRITKIGWLLASEREKTIPIRNISSIEVKKPGALVVGYIQFSIAGGVARNSGFTWTGGAFDAVADENSVLFTDQHSYQTALKIKEYVETFREHVPPANTSTISAADEILKLKGLMDQGIITPEEFESKKRRLLET